MHKAGRRNFVCPETDEPCTDARCLKDTLCCERERSEVAAKREKLARQERIADAEIWEIIKSVIEPKNSNDD